MKSCCGSVPSRKRRPLLQCEMTSPRICWVRACAGNWRVARSSYRRSRSFRRAVETDAGLIVMGACGHRRLRTGTVVGTTRDMLVRAPLPLLMAH